MASLIGWPRDSRWLNHASLRFLVAPIFQQLPLIDVGETGHRRSLRGRGASRASSLGTDAEFRVTFMRCAELAGNITATD